MPTTLQPYDLEPSLVGARTYVTRRRAGRVDAATLISVMICLLTLIPAQLVVPGLPDVGRPALIVCLLMFCWWVLVRLTSHHLVLMGPQPLRWAFLAFVLAMLASYAVGQLRGLTSMESSGADNQMLFLATFAGAALMVADGISNWFRLQVVVHVLVWCGTIVALLGLIQYVFAIDITQYLAVPGLHAKKLAADFQFRGSGIRVASTTTHYIELSTVLATILPFAIHLAIFAKSLWHKAAFACAAAILIAGIQATISRSGILGILIVFIVLVPVWGWRLRYNILVLFGGFLAAFAVIQPGLLKTVTTLFDDPSNNPAFTVRQDRYPLVWHYFGQRPWLGRGTGTYVSPQYQILDNEWLGLLISNGIIGVAALVALHITAIVLAALAMRRANTPEVRHLSAAAMSTQLIAIVVAGTYDSLSFLTYATVLALTIGMCGTLWRLTHPARVVRTSTTRWFARPTSKRA
jgi:polysaccharide biosynthesis protein PslJ